ncbi:MAG: cupin domain-containing protein [Nevskia sp.]|nr:cupin domain-containing protein [Nevskia sp.]
MAKWSDTDEADKALPRDIEAALFAGLAPAPVPAERAERIRSKIDAELGHAGPAVTHRLDDGGWIRRSPHFEIKIVNYDKLSGAYSFIGRLAANGSIEPHAHALAEECVILSGEMEVDGLTLRAGDYQVFEPGTRHGRLYSKTGALLFIRAELDLAA